VTRDGLAPGEARATLPLSVIVPAYRCAAPLRRAVDALWASDLPRDQWELVVVVDGGDDDTEAVARARADRVVVVPRGPRGPAHARNCGADVARGAVLAFVDADVCVRPDALRRLLAEFADPSVGAAFGAYDVAPAAPGVVSRYANLLHHRVHATHAGDAETFWAGCGAVRREVFRRVGGFDAARYRRPQIEDVELGHRIRDLGCRIVLRHEIQGTHLKRWTLRQLVVTSVRDRGVPWMELLLADGMHARPATLNVSGREQAHTALVGVTLLAAGAAWWDARWLLAAGGALALVLLGNAELLGWLWRAGGARVGLAGVPLRVLYYVLNGVSALWGTAHYVRARMTGRASQTRPRSHVPVPPSSEG
jgi:glycosyltransferase involved in cell wall biosynthesis